MSLEVRINGDKVKTFDEEVLTLRVNTSQGESSITHFAPDQKVVDITFDRVDPYGIPTLPQLDAEAAQALRDRVAKSTDMSVEPDVLQEETKKNQEDAAKAGKSDPDKAGPDLSGSSAKATPSPQPNTGNNPVGNAKK